VNEKAVAIEILKITLFVATSLGLFIWISNLYDRLEDTKRSLEYERKETERLREEVTQFRRGAAILHSEHGLELTFQPAAWAPKPVKKGKGA
jgi:hypothetical protein